MICEEGKLMQENQEQPGKRQATISLVIAVIAFLYLMFVPLYVTSFFTFVLGIVGLIQAARAKKRGFVGAIRTIGLLLSVLNTAISVLLIVIPVISLP